MNNHRVHQPLALLWNHIAGHIKAQVQPEAFQRWFEAVTLDSANEKQVTLGVPDQIYQFWIESNYLPLVHTALAATLGAPRTIRFKVLETVSAPEPAKPTVEDVEAPAAAANGTRREEPSDELFEIANATAVNEDVASLSLEASAPLAAGINGLSPRYNFDTFVVGENSRMAHAAAMAVAQNPGRTWNPLFVHGGTGLGKTHLMQAIGQSVSTKKKGAKVVYVSSEDFTNEFIDAIQKSSLVKFRKKYRQADILLIDDIQFFAGRDRTQEEFFHTFSTLMNGAKQIVLSSDRPPAEIQNLEHRLVSRFEWGMTTEIGAPDSETRMAILRKKAASMNANIQPEVIEFIGERIRSNIRRLEGALTRVAGYASLHGGSPSIEKVEEILRDILQEEGRRVVSIDAIQKRVAEHYDVRIADMTSKRRPANIAWPRQVAMFLSREMTKSSLSEIGEAFGGRDHGTVLHAHRTVIERIGKEEKTRLAVAFLKQHLSR